jgi:hypothetical protein
MESDGKHDRKSHANYENLEATLARNKFMYFSSRGIFFLRFKVLFLVASPA